MQRRSQLKNLKQVLTPTLSKVLDLIIKLKLNDYLRADNWLELCLNNNLNKFLKLYFTQTSKIEAQQLSAYLTASQWDFISLYLAKSAQKYTKYDFSSDKATQILFTSFYKMHAN